MSKRHGAKGRCVYVCDEAEDMNNEMREYEASLPSHMDIPSSDLYSGYC